MLRSPYEACSEEHADLSTSPCNSHGTKVLEPRGLCEAQSVQWAAESQGRAGLHLPVWDQVRPTSTCWSFHTLYAIVCR